MPVCLDAWDDGNGVESAQLKCDGEDAWDWLTGLKICEFSRSVVDSVERKFAIGGGCRDGTGVCPPICVVFTEKKDDSSISGEVNPANDDQRSPKSASDPPYINFRVDFNAEEEEKLADLPQAENNISNAPSEEDQSHESPRGVDYTFDPTTNNGKSDSAGGTAGKGAGGGGAETETATPSPQTSPGGRKKGRGIKSLFRRRK